MTQPDHSRFTSPEARPLGHRAASFPRWARVVAPIVLLLAWLAIGGIGGPTFGKISSVTTNDQASYLPASADSTKVNSYEAKFTGSDAIPAIVLYVSSEKLTSAEIGASASIRSNLASVSGVQRSGTNGTDSIIGPIPSNDGKAVEFIVPVTDENNVDGVVTHLRSTATEHKIAGTTVYVTGPAGLTADLVSAFGGIDGILLIVAVLAVLVILLVVYRALLLPFVVLLTSVFALCGAILLVYALAAAKVVTLTGQSQGILSILVIGAATDYSLLFVSRFREALHVHESKWDAAWAAWKAVLAPVTASAATVILGVLCLLFSDLNSNRGLGPVAALGIAFAYLAAITLLPALLALFGRAAFWPFRPKFEPHGHEPAHVAGDRIEGLEGATGLWRRIGSLIARRHRVVWVVCAILLVAASSGVLQLKASGIPQTDVVLGAAPASVGQKVLAKHYDAGSGAPVLIVTRTADAANVLTATRRVSGIASADLYVGEQKPTTCCGVTSIGAEPQPVQKDGRELIEATLSAQPDSDAAEQVVRALRAKLPSIDSSVLVGGQTALTVDSNDTAQRDLRTIIPLVLAVILLILILLLRSVLMPILLIATVVVSYGATLGIAALVFNHLFKFPGADPSVPLFGFVFLVALGVDYNIFLMTRVREESLAHGTRPGILRGLTATGSVITSAGIVLAATFAALAVIPILFLFQIAFIVAFGVLLDTIIVRTLLVPALAYDIGRVVWWPSRRLGRSRETSSTS